MVFRKGRLRIRVQGFEYRFSGLLEVWRLAFVVQGVKVSGVTRFKYYLNAHLLGIVEVPTREVSPARPLLIKITDIIFMFSRV